MSKRLHSDAEIPALAALRLLLWPLLPKMCSFLSVCWFLLSFVCLWNPAVDKTCDFLPPAPISLFLPGYLPALTPTPDSSPGGNNTLQRQRAAGSLIWSSVLEVAASVSPAFSSSEDPTHHSTVRELLIETICLHQDVPIRNMELMTVQFSSVPQLCPTLCDPMDCSTSGLPVHHQLPEFTHTHVHWVSDAIQPSHPLSSPSCHQNQPEECRRGQKEGASETSFQPPRKARIGNHLNWEMHMPPRRAPGWDKIWARARWLARDKAEGKPLHHKTWNCETGSRAVPLGSLTPSLSSQESFHKRSFAWLVCESWQEPTLGLWKGVSPTQTTTTIWQRQKGINCLGSSSLYQGTYKTTCC